MPNTRRVLMAGLALSAFLSTSCGSPGPPSVSSHGAAAVPTTVSTPPTQPDVVDPTPGDRVAIPESTRGGKVRIDPPAPTDQPGIDRDAAYRAYQKTNLYPEAAARGGAQVKFGLFTDDDFGTSNPDGTVTPTYKARRVWIVWFHHIPDEVGGSGGQPGAHSDVPDGPQHGFANLLVVLDADTGKFLLAVNDGAGST